MMTLAGHRVNDRASEHGRKGKDLFKLERAASFAEKDIFVVCILTEYSMWVP